MATAHGLIAVALLASIGYLWWCALTGRRGRVLTMALTALVTEGVLVATNGGDWPLGPLGERVGDPVPLFALVLPPTAACRAVPALGVVTVAGLAVLCSRGRRPAELGCVVRGRGVAHSDNDRVKGLRCVPEPF